MLQPVGLPSSRLLRLPNTADADLLFPLLFGTGVVDTILWDGPSSLESFKSNWESICSEAKANQRHYFVIAPAELGRPIGCCDMRPDEQRFRGNVGLWI